MKRRKPILTAKSKCPNCEGALEEQEGKFIYEYGTHLGRRKLKRPMRGLFCRKCDKVFLADGTDLGPFLQKVLNRLDRRFDDDEQDS